LVWSRRLPGNVRSNLAVPRRAWRTLANLPVALPPEDLPAHMSSLLVHGQTRHGLTHRALLSSLRPRFVFIPRRQEGAMDVLDGLLSKLRQLQNPFTDDRFPANVIAVHGLIVLAILACLLLRRMLARGGHRLVERTGWKWIEPVVEEAMRHGRR